MYLDLEQRAALRGNEAGGMVSKESFRLPLLLCVVRNSYAGAKKGSYLCKGSIGARTTTSRETLVSKQQSQNSNTG